MTEEKFSISYSKPTVLLMQDTGIGVAEIAARTCYDSFENSEHDSIKNFDVSNKLTSNMDLVNSINSSDLLDTLAWTHFHHSILEHSVLSFLIKGTSRGVLQEHARHRIQAISVRSTRYTMSSVINAFVASGRNHYWFANKMLELDMFVTTEENYNRLQIADIFHKLIYQMDKMGSEEFIKTSIAKSSLDYANNTESSEIKFKLLQDGKKKRNVGDAFKHIVNDNWKVDMVVSFNLRSLKNYFDLRDSGAAFFQIRWLAEAMKAQTPKKYLDLIVKGN